MLVLNIFKEKKYDKNKLLLEIIRLRNELFTKKLNNLYNYTPTFAF